MSKELRDILAEKNQEIDSLRAQLAALQTKQEPVAWRTLDGGEGGYDLRNYADNETYQQDWNERNPNHHGWVEPLYTRPAQPAAPTHCQCSACITGTPHASDCAVHNEPAYPNGPCSCGVAQPSRKAILEAQAEVLEEVAEVIIDFSTKAWLRVLASKKRAQIGEGE